MSYYEIEVEVPKGLEDVAREELHALYQDRIYSLVVSPAALRFGYQGNLGGLLALQTVYSVYRVITFEVPRPKALLGHQHFTQLIEAMREIISLHSQTLFRTLHIAAAGNQSTVMKRLVHELAESSGLVAEVIYCYDYAQMHNKLHGKLWYVFHHAQMPPVLGV